MGWASRTKAKTDMVCSHCGGRKTNGLFIGNKQKVTGQRKIEWVGCKHCRDKKNGQEK